MRSFGAPKVILVARPSLVAEGVGELLREYGVSPVHGWNRGDDQRLLSDGDGLSELMGRLCYGSFGARQGRIGADYHANVLEGGHGSVLEHACWSFVVTRASRGYTHQQVRHRAGWAYSQESQHFIRYADQGEPGWQEAGLCLTGWPDFLKPAVTEFVRGALEFYSLMTKAVDERARLAGAKTGLKKLVAGLVRGILPNILESRIGITANARALRHFCELRGQPDNVLEIRLVACEIARIMKIEAPHMFQDVEIGMETDGHPAVSSRWRKV